MWLTALKDLRIHLSDGATDKQFWRKRCFGEVNGSNRRFKVFDFRRVTDFTVTEGVYVGNVLIPTSDVEADDPISGQFILKTPPVEGVDVEATYNTQWFLDGELQDFLQQASMWLISSADYVNAVTPGLIPCTIEFAASRAYKKLAIKWMNYLSSSYKVEDAPKDEVSGRVDYFNKMADNARKEAETMRKEFYKRQDQPLQPLYGTLVGTVRQLP